jgi:D-alanyl-D-alanine endopeptidase (penicillin-binding protein 7)
VDTPLTIARRLLNAVLACLALVAAGTAWADVPLNSSRVMVVDEATGEVLLQKNSQDQAPMASLTKLLTAMVVLDAQQDPDERVTITVDDLDTLKHTHSGVRAGATLSRADLLERALLVSDNHAASALARNYPGGMSAFLAAAHQKIEVLKLTQTNVEEPTGLSPLNRSSAADMVRIVAAASSYPDIARITSQSSVMAVLGGKVARLKNTNQLVGKKGWDILLSKTGFTNEAGRCLAMRLRAAGRTVLLVLLDSPATSMRTLDAFNITRFLAGDSAVTALPREQPVQRYAMSRARANKAHVRSKAAPAQAARTA